MASQCGQILLILLSYIWSLQMYTSPTLLIVGCEYIWQWMLRLKSVFKSPYIWCDLLGFLRSTMNTPGILERPSWFSKKETWSLFDLFYHVHLDPDHETWKDNLCNSQILTQWENSWSNTTIKIVWKIWKCLM